MPLAGNIAYRTLLATFPFLIFLATLGGIFGDASLATRTVDFLLSVAPEYIVKPLSHEIHNVLSTPQRGLFTLSSSSRSGRRWVALIPSACVSPGLRHPGDAQSCDDLSHFAGVRGGRCVRDAGCGGALIAAPIALDYLQTHLPESALFIRQLDNIRYPLAIVLLATMLTIFHLVLPAGRRRISEVWPGVIFTLIVWVLMAVAYRYYLAYFPLFTTTYAGLGGIVAALFFLYLAAIVLIFGGELNRVLMLRREARNRVPLPAPRRR